MRTHTKPFRALLCSIAVLGLFSLSGCAGMNLGGQGAESPIQEAPYFAHEFSDLLIPKELHWNRDKSMFVRTESFAGGVLHYSGRVDLDSVADFFSNTMVKNGWKMVGSAKYKNVLLAFVKPDKTCTIIIGESDLRYRTEVHIYINEDIVGRGQRPLQSNPFGTGM
jgi:hypothetical protein